MRRIGMQLIAEKKAAILAESREKGRGIERKDLRERDLLTLLIKANMASDIPESQRLSDDEVLARTYAICSPFTAALTFVLQRSQRTLLTYSNYLCLYAD
jgi:hypothetical protein